MWDSRKQISNHNLTVALYTEDFKQKICVWMARLHPTPLSQQKWGHPTHRHTMVQTMELQFKLFKAPVATIAILSI